MTVLIVSLGLVVALLAVLVAGLLRSHAEILRELHDLKAAVGSGAGATAAGLRSPVDIQTRPGVALPRGSEASARDIVGVSPTGDAVKIGVAHQQHRTLLAFLSSGCLTCRNFWEAFASPSDLGLPDGVRVVIVTKDADHEQPALIAKLAPPSVPTVMAGEAWDAYDVPVAPYFILVDGPSGRVVGEGASATWVQVRELLGQALDDTAILDQLRQRGGATGVRDRDTDDEFLRAGITPGHSSLYPDETPPEAEAD